MKLESKDYFIFSGGEVHCRHPACVGAERIVCLDYTMNGFMAACERKEMLHRYGMMADLTYPYFPYARQDRIIKEQEPFSLKIFCELLNSQNFNSVTVYDPHSDVTPALIKNCKVIHQWHIANSIIPRELLDDPNVIFVSPDAGAYKKVSKLITNDYRIAIGTKVRGSKGDIIKTELYSPVDLKGKTCVVVDDICDGGRTFIELGKVLKHKGAEKLHLYITHGIFSAGLDELLKYFDCIYTTDSFNQSKYNTDKLKVHNIC